MDYLQELWDLYESAVGQPKPDLQEPSDEAVSGPNKGNIEHPVIQDRKKVDALRLSGMSATDAHQEVHGNVDLSNTDAKGKLSSTLGRTQQDGNKRGVHVEKDAEHKSIFAKDEELQKNVTSASAEDLKTPMNKEVPDALQEPEVDVKEEYDYNADVSYLQKFGRA
jgi:hypothetical protein